MTVFSSTIYAQKLLKTKVNILHRKRIKSMVRNVGKIDPKLIRFIYICGRALGSASNDYSEQFYVCIIFILLKVVFNCYLSVILNIYKTYNPLTNIKVHYSRANQRYCTVQLKGFLVITKVKDTCKSYLNILLSL